MNASEWLDYLSDPNPRPLGAQWWGPEPAPTRTMNADQWLDYLNDPEPRALAPEFAAFVDDIRRWSPGAIVVGVEGPGVSLGHVRAWGADGSMSATEWQQWVSTGALPAGKTSPWRRPGTPT